MGIGVVVDVAPERPAVVEVPDEELEPEQPANTRAEQHTTADTAINDRLIW